MPALCRDCEFRFDRGDRCPNCRSPRIAVHPELETLHIAHMDCDAFFASVEKRDNPDLRERPVIVGGGKRGVVATACYIARIYGVRSAMPMVRALKICPEAVVVRPRMEAYAQASREIRTMMQELTPDVEPLSLDEAFLDLSGTVKLHGAPPAIMMVRLVNRMEKELRLTGSVGLSHNKFLAKLASDLQKPRGFSVIGKTETESFLADKPVSLIWGVGTMQQKKLRQAGIVTFADLRTRTAEELTARFGENGRRLFKLARGEDQRLVNRQRVAKSLSNETTFEKDEFDRDVLEGFLWNLSIKVADRAKAKQLQGRVVTLKVKRRDFKTMTRRRTLPSPTCMAEMIFTTARWMLQKELTQAPFRLIGVGISQLSAATDGLEVAGFDPQSVSQIAAERASDALRRRYGKDIIFKGMAYKSQTADR
ncbi:MAG: DNA polymerase IV [Rhodobacteraceae bacterium]|nr:DNA polymerase IV [Paracoccaceae bacterium]